MKIVWLFAKLSLLLLTVLAAKAADNKNVVDRTVHVFFKAKSFKKSTPEQLAELTKQFLLEDQYTFATVEPRDFEQQNPLTTFIEVVLEPF